MPADGLLQTLQKLATALHRLDELSRDVREFRQAVTGRIEHIEEQWADVRERLARLEAGRDADLAKLQADISRFKTEVERAELRLSRPLKETTRTPKPPKSG